MPSIFADAIVADVIVADAIVADATTSDAKVVDAIVADTNVAIIIGHTFKKFTFMSKNVPIFLLNPVESSI